MATPVDDALDRMAGSVTNNATVIGSATALLTDLSTLLRESADDPDRIRSIADAIDANTAGLAAAVLASTPAADTEEPPPPDPGRRRKA